MGVRKNASTLRMAAAWRAVFAGNEKGEQGYWERDRFNKGWLHYWPILQAGVTRREGVVLVADTIIVELGQNWSIPEGSGCPTAVH
jgi:hypothetical protein